MSLYLEEEDGNWKQEAWAKFRKLCLWVVGVCLCFHVFDAITQDYGKINTDHRYQNRDPTKDAYHIKSLDMVNGIIEYREYTPGFDFINPMGIPSKGKASVGVKIQTKLTWEEILEQLDLDEEDLLDYINENY